MKTLFDILMKIMAISFLIFVAWIALGFIGPPIVLGIEKLWKKCKFFRKLFDLKEVKAALGVLDELDYICNSSDFQLARKIVESTILARQDKFAIALKKQGRTPRQKVYSMMESAVGDYLESGRHDFFVYRGVLTPTGEELLKIYDRIIDQMREIDYISEEEAHKQKNNIRDRIKETG